MIPFFSIAAAILLAAIAWACARPASVVRAAPVVLATVALVSAVAVWALVDPSTPGMGLWLDSSEEPMLPTGDPAQQAYRDAIRTFGDDDVYVIAVESGDTFSAENLSALQSITRAIRRLDGVRRTESLVDAVVFRYEPDGEMVTVERLVQGIPDSQEESAALRVRALADPILTRTIVAADGRASAINVLFRDMTDGEFIAAGLDESIHSILLHQGLPGQIFSITGRPHIKARAHHMMVQDLLQLIPLALLVGVAMAWLSTGSLRMGVVPVGASAVATLWVLGSLVYLGRPLNIITLVLAPMLLCVGSVYGVHVLARYDGFVVQLTDRRSAAEACLRYVRVPVMIAGVTTAVGFSVLGMSSTPAVRELAAFSVLGVAAITALSLVAVPSAAALLPQASPAAAEIGRIEGLLRRVAHLAVHHSGAVLMVWATLTIAALAMIPHIRIDTDYLTFFDRTSAVRTDFSRVGELLPGAVPLYVTVDGGDEGAFRTPENLRSIARLQSALDEIPGVVATVSLVDFVRKLNRAVERGDPAAFSIPASRGEVAELVFMVPKATLRRFANSNHSRVNIVVRTNASGSSVVRELETRILEAIAEAALPAHFRTAVTGNTVVLNHGADEIAATQLRTVGTATFGIFVAILLAFASVRLGLVAMLPNLIPVLMFFGVLGCGVAALSLPTSLIGCIALGLAIDDTAHFLTGYRRRREQGSSPEQAATDCVEQLGRPIVVTSLMLGAGFLVLSLSGFATLRELGQLLALTMTVCLGADLLMLPALLVRARV